MDRRKFSTAMCYSLIFLCAVILTVMSPLLSEIAKAYNLDMAQSGLLFTAQFVGFSLFILFGGIAADRFGKKAVLSVNLIVMTVFIFLFSIAPNYIFACIFMFFIGGSTGILESIANALVADINPIKRSFYINLAQVFFGVGALAGPLLSGLMVTYGIDWRAVYQVIAASFAIAAIAFVANKLPPLPPNDRIDWSSFKSLVSDKKFLVLCACMFLYTGSEVGAWGWMATFMKETLHFDILKSSMAVGLFWLAMIVGRLIFTPLSLKYPPKALVRLLAFSATASTVFSGLVHNEILIWLGVALLGLTYSSQWSLIVAYGSEQYQQSTGTVFALLVGSGGIGMAVVPLFMGVVGQYISVNVSMISPALFFLIIGIIFILIDVKKNKADDLEIKI